MKCPNCGGTDVTDFNGKTECSYCGMVFLTLGNSDRGSQQTREEHTSWKMIVQCLESPTLNEAELKRNLDDFLSDFPNHKIALCLNAYLSRKDDPENFKTSILNLKEMRFQAEEDRWLFPFLIHHLESQYFDVITDVLVEKNLFGEYRLQLDEAKRQLETAVPNEFCEDEESDDDEPDDSDDRDGSDQDEEDEKSYGEENETSEVREYEVLQLFEKQCYEEAVRLLEKMEGQPTESLTYYYLADCFENGLGTDIDLDKAKELYEVSEMIHSGSDDHLSEYYYLMGKKYSKGELLPQNYGRAFELFKRSSDLGNGLGMYNLGICYKTGYGTEKDENRAYQVFNMAKDVIPKEAYYQLGICYENGLGVSIDNQKAVECFERSANAGNEKAMCNLGIHYYYGTGVEQDYHKAVDCYKKSSECGNSIALYNLAQCYFKGHGVEEDRHQAKELFQQSALKGNKKAAHFLIDNY